MELGASLELRISELATVRFLRFHYLNFVYAIHALRAHAAFKNSDTLNLRILGSRLREVRLYILTL